MTVTSVLETAGGLRVTFGPDGHRAVFTANWLAGHAAAGGDTRTEDAKRLWSAADFATGAPAVAWTDYQASDHIRLGSRLRQLLSAGFLLLRGVPAEPGAVLRVAGTLGYVRETNYGRLFDVRVKATRQSGLHRPANRAAYR